MPLKNEQSNQKSAKPIHEFFKPGKHHYNYKLHIPTSIKSELNKMWNPAPENKNDPQTYNQDQLFVTKVNALFRSLEREGPKPKGYQVTIDKKHGKFNRPKVKTAGFHHTHVSDGSPTFVVMWLADKEKKLISIVNMGAHGNFNYKKKVDPENLLDKANSISYKK